MPRVEKRGIRVIGVDETRQYQPHGQAVYRTLTPGVVRPDGGLMVDEVLAQPCVRARLLVVVAARVVVISAAALEGGRPSRSWSKC